MKQFLQSKSHILKEAPLYTIHDSPLGTAKSKPSPSRKQLGSSKHTKENFPPLHSDVNSPSPSPASKLKSPLPPRPPASNPLKRKLCLDPAPESSSPDSGVQVIVRMRPLNKAEEDGETIITKSSDNSVAISGHTFTFDSIADKNSTQEDVFNLVGSPLVENCLAGFNSSVFAYGQTGSGKTYTMWGPANSLVDDNLDGDQHGLTPRVFQRLFNRIDEEQAKHEDKQLNYHCRCSFLEIYNEQITDLLDPTQKNLQIREDVNTGVYVENLREEYIFSLKDVMRFLVKGLSNRRTGATSINAESSRSHSVFTCVVESRCKKNNDAISSVKTSRINLVDLAGSERQKLTGAGGERLKEAGNINRSLSQLGNVINILAEVSQTGKQRHIPYRDSRLTFLLQESLGGNAKLAMVCAVSPSTSCKNETFSTLRFAQRAKSIKNKAVVNEETEDDVNHLREVIRQLRDELHHMKSNGGNSSGWNARKSLILLKSLAHPRAKLHDLDDDGDEEMEIDEEAVENLINNSNSSQIEHVSEDAEPHTIHENVEDDDKTVSEEVPIPANDGCSPILKSPTPSISPTVSSSRKSQRTFTSLSASRRNSNTAKSMICPSNTMEMQKPPSKTASLASSLHRGLEILENHRKSFSLRRSSFRFYAKPLDSKPTFQLNKVDAAVQTLPGELDSSQDSSAFLCSNCKRKAEDDLQPVDDRSSEPDDSADKPKLQVPKAVEKVLAGAIRREMALEEICAKQASEISQLNRLVQQYKHERECNAIIGQTREDKIFRLESLADGILSSNDYLEDEINSLRQENHLLKEMCQNHPDVLKTTIDLQKVEKELEQYKNFYDLGEKDVLLEEIHDLRTHLHFYLDPSKTPPPADAKLMTLVDELKSQLDTCRVASEKQKRELETEKRCAQELKEAMQIAMQGHARLLEQYADLEEKHIDLLGRHRTMQEGINDVKKTAARAGVRGAESKFISALAAEITALKLEREKERRIFRDENRGLQVQLRDTAEAVQAAGELLVRLKEAEEAIYSAQWRAIEAEKEKGRVAAEMEMMKQRHVEEICSLKALMEESRLNYREAVLEESAGGEKPEADDDELSKFADTSTWFSGHDRCNI